MDSNTSAYKFQLKGFMALMILINCSSAFGQIDESLMKAAYIERMTRFIEWPVKSTLNENSFIIGVFGDNDFYATLFTAFKGKQIKNQDVKIIQVMTPDQLSICKICYLSNKASKNLTAFISAANSSGALLISESEDFGNEGVHINFYIEDDKLKFEINETSITSAGFKVSYLLLQNTRIIQ
jgi:hypothetical protein